MRICKQLEHLPVDDDEAPQLPNRVGAHVAREAGRHGRIVGLLVGLAVGTVVGHVRFLFDFISMA